MNTLFAFFKKNLLQVILIIVILLGGLCMFRKINALQDSIGVVNKKYYSGRTILKVHNSPILRIDKVKGNLMLSVGSGNSQSDGELDLIVFKGDDVSPWFVGRLNLSFFREMRPLFIFPKDAENTKLKIITRSSNEYGFRVITANSPVEFMSRFDVRPFDVDAKMSDFVPRDLQNNAIRAHFVKVAPIKYNRNENPKYSYERMSYLGTDDFGVIDIDGKVEVDIPYQGLIFAGDLSVKDSYKKVQINYSDIDLLYSEKKKEFDQADFKNAFKIGEGLEQYNINGPILIKAYFVGENLSLVL